MSEFAPPGKNVRMTKAQIKKYIANMKVAQIIAEEKIKLAKESGELDKEKQELAELEKKLDEIT